MIKNLQTETSNKNTVNIDKVGTAQMVQMFYEEDKIVADAVYNQSQKLTKIIDLIANCYSKGGRIIYVGAGNSGRIAMCDATECPPTFNINPDRVIAVVAGGVESLHSALESIEDNMKQAIVDVERLNPTKDDVIIGLSASGRTPYVKSVLTHFCDNTTIAISCNINSEISKMATEYVEIDVGPEVIAGSTRLKAGTAQKMILNMISTIVMIKQGYVRENKMINVKITNEKLMQRGVDILRYFFDLSQSKAEQVLKQNNLDMKKAFEQLEIK